MNDDHIFNTLFYETTSLMLYIEFYTSSTKLLVQLHHFGKDSIRINNEMYINIMNIITIGPSVVGDININRSFIEKFKVVNVCVILNYI